ncbi:MAG: type II and III secretion system protein family protein [Sphingomonadaceae bacterium]|nr:type II and III secretion system protein family protein [Sphingomonadaceae bacterium]
MASAVRLALATLAFAAAAGPAHAAAPAGTAQNDTAAARHAGALDVALGKSHIIRVDQPFGQLIVGNPEVADVVPLTDQSVYVLGKRFGSTNLSVYDRQRRLLAVMDVNVGPDVGGLKRQLAELLPGEPVSARMAADSIVLTGTVSSPAAADRAMQLAQKFAPAKDSVVNLMGVGAPQQVLLEVKIAEVRRSALQQLGINTAIASRDFLGTSGTSAPGSASLSNGGSAAIDRSTLSQAFAILAGRFTLGGTSVASALDALEQKGFVKTLADPNLVAVSGETASFLVGGEFPIPVAQTSAGNATQGFGSSITVEFKQFGVSLAFTPTVLSNGMMSLSLLAEVSSIDPSASFSSNGLSIPGLATRRVRTTVEMRDGEGFAVAGLIRRDFQNTIRAVPVLGTLPVIGQLFRSNNFQNNETELVVVIVPRLVRPTHPSQIALPTDLMHPPTQAQFYGEGRIEGAAAAARPDPARPLSAQPAPSAGPILN